MNSLQSGLMTNIVNEPYHPADCSLSSALNYTPYQEVFSTIVFKAVVVFRVVTTIFGQHWLSKL